MSFSRSKAVLNKLKEIQSIDPTAKYLYNRNPKNLEKLRIAYRNDGFFLEKPGRSFYNKYTTIKFYNIRTYFYKIFEH